MKEKLYDKSFLFRLKKSDIEELKRKSKDAGLNESAYLRLLIHGTEPKHREDYEDIKKLIYEINQIGTNINQISTHFNSGLFNEYEKNKLFALMQTLVKNTDEIIKKNK